MDSSSHEVVIIGGGVIGLSAAYFLARNGRDVAVVERGAIGKGTSSGNAGLIVPSHVIPLASPEAISQGIRWLFRRDSPFYIRPRLNWSLLQWLWQFRRASTKSQVDQSIPVLHNLSTLSSELYDELANNSELDSFAYRQDGLLMVHSTANGRQHDVAEAAHARDAGLDVDVLERDELHAVEPHVPDDSVGGVYYHQDACLNPSAFLASLTSALVDRGVSLYEETEVTGFGTDGGVVSSVRSKERELSANSVVMATGAWTPLIAEKLGLRLPVQPAKGYSLSFAREADHPQVPFLLSEKKVSVTPMGEVIRFAGTLELAGYDYTVDRRRLNPIHEVAASYVGPGKSRNPDVWVGLRPCTPDGLPFIGRTENFPNVIVAAGHAMIGVSLAPATGLLVSQLIQGKQPEIDLEPLRPGRFN